MEEPVQKEFVSDWKVDELSPFLIATNHARNLLSGRAAFTSQCANCHRFGTGGGVIGPDLTSVASRFSRRELLEHILLPSQVISDRFATVSIVRIDGEEVSGIILEENAEKLILQCNAVTPMKTEVLRADIQSSTESKVSMMPEGLLNYLTQDEILDLLAFLENGAGEQSTTTQ